jgi:hypothetical protein
LEERVAEIRYTSIPTDLLALKKTTVYGMAKASMRPRAVT